MWVLLILGAFFTCVVLEFCVMEESFREFTMYVPGKVGFVFVTRPMPTAERNLVMVVFGAGSLGLGLASGLVSAVALHHWRRWAQALLMVLLAAAAAGSAGFSIWERVASRAPDLIGFGLTLVAIHALLQVFGGLIGVRFGRPFARLLVRMFIPPGWRGPLAFLWLVDGREPPLRPAAVEAAGRAPAGSIA